MESKFQAEAQMEAKEAHAKMQSDPVAQRIIAVLKQMQREWGKERCRQWLANWEEKKLAEGKDRPEAIRDFVRLVKFETGL